MFVMPCSLYHSNCFVLTIKKRNKAMTNCCIYWNSKVLQMVHTFFLKKERRWDKVWG